MVAGIIKMRAFAILDQASKIKFSDENAEQQFIELEDKLKKIIPDEKQRELVSAEYDNRVERYIEKMFGGNIDEIKKIKEMVEND